MRRRNLDPCGPGRRGSFTLIEMLVVIAIIGILGALLAPTITGVRERARSAQCRNNLRNLAVAALNYAHTYRMLPNTHSVWRQDLGDERWRLWIGWIDWQPGTYENPADGTRGTDGDPPLWWGDSARWSITNSPAGKSYTAGSLWRFTGGNMKMYICPTFARQCGTERPDGTRDAPVRSYVMGPRVHHVELVRLTDASRRLLFADGCLHDLTSAGGSWSLKWDGKFDIAEGELIGGLHDGYGNAVFADGHIEAVRPEDIQKALDGSW